jgi:spermidine/putrescine transport system permease protein
MHTHRQLARRAMLLSAPGSLWILALLIAPLLFVLAISFFSTGTYGEIERPLTSENYKRFLGFGTFGWEPLYPLIIARSLWTAALSTALCLALALPMAFFIASLSPRQKTAALVLVTIPLWTNLLIRTYAWQILLGGTPFYPGAVAVYVGLVCDYLPFLVLPLYASVEKINWTLAEAAQDLGASRWNTFRHAIWPQIKPGTVAGVILVFVPATGQFVIPDLLGGARTVLLGNVIQQQFGPSQNWPFGSALATAAMLLVLAALWFYARAAREQQEVRS